MKKSKSKHKKLKIIIPKSLIKIKVGKETYYV